MQTRLLSIVNRHDAAPVRQDFDLFRRKAARSRFAVTSYNGGPYALMRSALKLAVSLVMFIKHKIK